MRVLFRSFTHANGGFQVEHACLERAFKMGDSKELKLMALDDPDLEPLWKQIGEL